MTDYISQGFCADCLHPAASAIPTLRVGPGAPAPPGVSDGLQRAWGCHIWQAGASVGHRANVRVAVSLGGGAGRGSVRVQGAVGAAAAVRPL